MKTTTLRKMTGSLLIAAFAVCANAQTVAPAAPAADTKSAVKAAPAANAKSEVRKQVPQSAQDQKANVSQNAPATVKQMPLAQGVTIEQAKKLYATDMVNAFLMQVPQFDRKKLETCSNDMADKIVVAMKAKGVDNEWANYQCDPTFRKLTDSFIKKEVDSMKYLGEVLILFDQYPALKKVMNDPNVIKELEEITAKAMAPIVEDLTKNVKEAK